MKMYGTKRKTERRGLSGETDPWRFTGKGKGRKSGGRTVTSKPQKKPSAKK